MSEHPEVRIVDSSDYDGLCELLEWCGGRLPAYELDDQHDDPPVQHLFRLPNGDPVHDGDLIIKGADRFSVMPGDGVMLGNWRPGERMIKSVINQGWRTVQEMERPVWVLVGYERTERIETR